MPQYLKTTLKVLGIIIGLCLVLWLSIIGYIHYNKEGFVRTITKQINNNINGSVLIDKIDPTILRGFPDISFRLEEIVVRDGNWDIHHKDLANISRGYISIDVWSALKGNAYINKITLQDGDVMIYTDEDSLSNTNLSQKKSNKQNDIKNPFEHLELDNITFTIKHKVKKKDFVLAISNCAIETEFSDTGWVADMDAQVKLNSFSFNTDKGSFMKDKMLDAEIQLRFDEAKQVLTLPLQEIRLDDFPYMLGGDFIFSEKPYSFNLDIEAGEVPYDNILEILTPAISSKLTDINVPEVDNVMIKLIGKMKYRDTPYVKAHFKVQDRTLTVPHGKINNCSFSGYFLNVMEEGMGHGDLNSMIYVDTISGDFYGMGFTATGSSVKNLAAPMLRTHFTSGFKVVQLNDVIGAQSFKFNGGDASVNLDCTVPLNEDDNRHPKINGNITFSNTAFSYIPRGLDFKKAKGKIVFDDKDVLIKDLQLKSEKNVLTLNATVDNLLNLYYTAPEKVVVDCDIKSDKISLDEYVGFIGNRRSGENNTSSSTAPMKKFADQLDAVFAKSTVDIDLSVNEVVYKRFQATDVHAEVALKKSEVELDNVRLKHADGTLTLSGSIQPEDDISNYNVKADIKEVNVRKLFYAFKNFGQDAIADSNIQGIVSVKADAKGQLKSSGDIVPNSLNGKVDYNLKNGRLIDFEPFGTIAKIIFFNRDLDDIQVKPLSGSLYVKNSNVTIPHTVIETSAFNIFTEGVYGIPKGTSILVQVPLKKPNKNQESMTEKDMKKGIVINLHATDNNTGDVKIKLGKGPFKE